jgi:peptidoglycan/xylan/chitin deacetylase (PgdA/CDA1 family)
MRRLLSGHRGWVIAIGTGLVLLGTIVVALLVVAPGQEAIGPSPTPTTTANPSTSISATTTATSSPLPTITPAPTTTSQPTPMPTPRPMPTPSPTPSPAPSRQLPASLRGVEWYTLPTDRKIVALTFDAGSGDQGLARILKTLSDKNVPGTFFLTGQFIQRYPADARAVATVERHSIGNHTWDHPHMNQLSDAAVRDEILSAEQSIVAVTGRQPWPLFRFPYGESSARTIANANSLGYGSLRWTVDTLGWEGTKDANDNPTGQSVATVISRSLNAARPGEIVLMHVGAAPDGTTLDADALPATIDGLRARGYSFVAIWDFIYGLN